MVQANNRKRTASEEIEQKSPQVANDSDLVDSAIRFLGKPKEDLSRPWIRRLCMLNGLLHTRMVFVESRDKLRYKAQTGKSKLGIFAVMNMHYTGLFRTVLVLHILSGLTAHVGSALAIALEQWKPRASKMLAKIASAAELFVHAPSALAMSPIVYGDKGITPPVYTIVSLALGLSAASSLKESLSDEPLEKGIRPELRRMCSTIGIFLYVRLYALMRGPNNFLEPQKYALAVVMAGLTMAPVGWNGGMFPATFWTIFFYNIRTVAQTGYLVDTHGVDAAAKAMSAQLRVS